MISKVHAHFWRLLNQLPEQIQQMARERYADFIKDPGLPGLRFKKLQGTRDLWSVRLNDDYRAVCQRSGDTVVWVWIGSHREFDKLF